MPQCLRKLIDAGCDLNQPGQLGHTPLFLAVTHADDREKKRSARAKSLLISLLEAGADPNQAFLDRGCFIPRGSTPLLCAASLRHPHNAKEACRVLLEGRAAVSTPSPEGWTALEVACSKHSSDPSLMRLLVSAQADLEAPNRATRLQRGSPAPHGAPGADRGL